MNRRIQLAVVSRLESSTGQCCSACTRSCCYCCVWTYHLFSGSASWHSCMSAGQGWYTHSAVMCVCLWHCCRAWAGLEWGTRKRSAIWQLQLCTSQCHCWTNGRHAAQQPRSAEKRVLSLSRFLIQSQQQAVFAFKYGWLEAKHSCTCRVTHSCAVRPCSNSLNLHSYCK